MKQKSPPFREGCQSSEKPYFTQEKPTSRTLSLSQKKALVALAYLSYFFSAEQSSNKGSFMFAPRFAKTTLPCPRCAKNLEISRTCHMVFMRCPHCQKQYPLEEFISKADAAMEEFLENVYFDRI